MYIYQVVNGKKVFKEIRCDYTGKQLDEMEMYCGYVLDYESNDPCFGSSGAEYHFGEKHGVEMFDFLNGAYHFSTFYESQPAEMLMMQEALKCRKDEKSVWFNCLTFDAMCRTSRIATAEQLIEKGLDPDSLTKS